MHITHLLTMLLGYRCCASQVFRETLLCVWNAVGNLIKFVNLIEAYILRLLFKT